VAIRRAGVLAGLAILTKYSAVTLLPYCPFEPASDRKFGDGGCWIGGAVDDGGGYEWMTAMMYGEGCYLPLHPLRNASDCVSRRLAGERDRCLAFAGGSLLPLMFFAPWLWRRRTLLVMGSLFRIVAGGVSAGCNLGCSSLGKYQLLNHWNYQLQ